MCLSFSKAGKPTIFKFLSIIARNQNYFLKELFHIISGHPENNQQVLSLRFGEKHIGFVISDKSGNEIYELVYCSVEDCILELKNDFISKYPSIQNSFYKVNLSYDFPQNILTPSLVYNSVETKLLLESAYGLFPGSNIVSELITEWQLYNSYAVPEEILIWVNEKFPAAKTMHQFTLTIKKINSSAGAGYISVDFRKDDFTMLVAGNSRILLAQTFEYKTPDDVIYYLLKTCSQFSLAQRDVNLQVSGLIERDSALYKEMYQYFILINFRDAAWRSANEFPAHYFTSFNDLAQCAS
jgi:Protein of unknown function (DUF3822)